MLKVAGVGSRDFKDLAMVQRFVDALPDNGVVLVSGCARGVDHAFAGGVGDGQGIWRNKRTDNAKPQIRDGMEKWEITKAMFARNSVIASRCDIMVVFWCNDSGGSANAVTKAVQRRKPVHIIGPHGEGFDEALAAVLSQIDTKQEFDDSFIQQGIEDQRIGRMIRAMPCNNKIHRLPYYNKGQMTSEFTIYNTMGDLVAFSEDPHAALVSAFGRYVKGEKHAG